MPAAAGVLVFLWLAWTIPTSAAPAPAASAPAAASSVPAATPAQRPGAKPPSPGVAGASPAGASAPASGAAGANAQASAAKSFRVQVLYLDKTGQAPRAAVGAVVRLQGSEQTFSTNASGVAEVFGALGGKPLLTVIVVNAAICNLPIKAGGIAGATVTVVVPRRGQGSCRFGP